jgi:hypothetical protein
VVPTIRGGAPTQWHAPMPSSPANNRPGAAGCLNSGASDRRARACTARGLRMQCHAVVRMTAGTHVGPSLLGATRTAGAHRARPTVRLAADGPLPHQKALGDAPRPAAEAEPLAVPPARPCCPRDAAAGLHDKHATHADVHARACVRQLLCPRPTGRPRRAHAGRRARWSLAAGTVRPRSRDPAAGVSGCIPMARAGMMGW